ncbi:MAG: hypothetical protein HY329_22300, partial [Chloroflexi bacterium]|nr:hypothetical protein [Chloroflexota bacterium]
MASRLRRSGSSFTARPSRPTRSSRVGALAGGGAVASVSHGTTVATNALLAEEFPGLGLVTTEGFRHVLE